jgi:serine/threonine protein kinase
MEFLANFVNYSVNKTFSEKEVIKLGQDICSALELCSRANIIHRDIKPENIFVSSHGDYKLGDFGIAKVLDRNSGIMTVISHGKQDYVAPEITKSGKYDATVDIYSLGILLYKLLNNNKLPFIDPFSDKITSQGKKTAIDKRLRGEGNSCSRICESTND